MHRIPKHTSEGMEVVKFNALLVAKISSIYLEINQLKNTFHL